MSTTGKSASDRLGHVNLTWTILTTDCFDGRRKCAPYIGCYLIG
jgi:hypothetical protein